MNNKYLILIFIFLINASYGQKDLKIISSSNDFLVLEYEPLYISKDTLTINNKQYLNIELLNGVEKTNTIVGSPAIPKRILSVGVPSEFGNNIRILSTEFQTIRAKVKPVPNIKKINGFPSYKYLENENYILYENPELVSFGEFGLVRDLILQLIELHPVQFDAINQEIKLYSRIRFQINFSKSKQPNQILKSELTKDLVINSKVVNSWNKSPSLSKKSDVKNSVLASGEWYRFEVPKEGIYKIDREYLSNAGIDVSNLDPRSIKIYNNGGYNLSWNPNAERPIDLVENAIIVEGENDGAFDTNDYILFYGRGVDFWEYNNISDRIARNKHFYSKNNYYWLTFGGNQGKRMGVQENESGTPILTQTTTKSFKFRDNDNRNLMGSGLLFVEDNYNSSSNSKTYINMLESLEEGSTIKYSFQFVNGSKKSNLLTIDENGKRIFSRTIVGASTSYQDYRYGAMTKSSTVFTGSIPDNRSVLKFTFNPSGLSDNGHLDYIEIEYIADMTKSINNYPLIFFSENIDGLIEYKASLYSDSNFKIYNISNYSDVKIVNTQVNGGGFTFQASENSNFSSKYISINDYEINFPAKAERVENSNIRGYSQGAKYIIISPQEFAEQADRLKYYRSNDALIKTTSFTAIISEVYNEFSGGSLDPTAIRDFLKYAYDNWIIKPEYVLLFGDGDFDYFNTLGKDQNFIPSFQSIESLYEIGSFPFDDFYSRISGEDKLADIGIGRLNITNNTEAKIVVDKIISYETKASKGLWRNKITLLGDDGLTSDGNDGSIHTRQSENLSKFYIPNSFDRNKIYLSSYQTINTGSGRRKPDCNVAIIDAMNNGTLIFNYIGHGNPDVWAHENVFDRSASIPQLRNKELFFLTAATCDFGKYDNPNIQSATEEMILMENGGIIGGLSAARPVFSGQNAALNQVFYSYMLGERDSLGFPVPIGKAFHKLKHQRSSDNDEKFHLFGDPLLRLNIPKLSVDITTINDLSSQDTVIIKALSDVSIKGNVLNTSSSQSGFEGQSIITVFDSEQNILLDDINYNISDQGGVIFRGRVSVTNGDFETSFTVPKDISYENKNGKITAYIFNDEIDGVGISDNIIIGGTDSSKSNDGKGPDIEILFDESEDSYLVNPNFNIRVRLFDETGLNTSGTGIGHKLEAVLNGDIQNSIDLTNYFLGDLNSGGKSGEVNYNFSALEPGEYTIKVNAWDVYNNFASEEDYFTVVDENKLVIREIYNYPNPFSSNTYFTFQHNLNNALNVRVRVYTIAGRVIKEIESFNIEDKFVKIEWDGKDEDNNKIGNGTYLYKLIVETIDGEYKENILGKIAVIR